MTTLEKSSIKEQDISLQLQTIAIKKPIELWSEIKCIGKSIKRRSYHSSVIYKDQLYVYGGYDINIGIMADFHKINLKHNTTWINLTKDDQTYPGARHGHIAVVNNGKMYLFGGKINSMSSTNKIHVYDFQSDTWREIVSTGQIPQNIDSHSAVVHQNKIFIFGGFLSSAEGTYSNSIFSFNIQTSSWVQLSSDSKSPSSRANSSLQIIGNNLYVFGGSNLSEKFKDLWKFDILSSKWQLINPKQNSQIPDTRAGHTLTSFGNNLLLFGGIQNITHQKDDLFIFNTDSQTWNQIQNTDTNALSQIINNQDQTQSELTKRNNDLKSTTSKLKKSTNKIINLHDKSLQREKTQQLSKNEIRRQQLLSQFELTAQQNQRYRNPSPTLQSLKSSIQSINPPQKKKQFQFNQTKQIIKKTVRKRPCARDGHTATLLQDQIIFMGGDRHLMGFNDIYILNLQMLK